MADTLRLEDRPLKELRDMALVELAHELLQSLNEPFYYRDLMGRVAALRQMTETEAEEAIARLYTDINIDGRFVCTGDNVWGLKRWYPSERTTDRSAGKRFVRRDVDPDEEDDEELAEEDETLDEEASFALDEEETPFDEEAAEEEDAGFLEEAADGEDETETLPEEEEEEDF